MLDNGVVVICIGKRDITSFRYLWIKYVKGFDEFLKVSKRKNIGITSEVVQKKFGEFA